MVVPDMSRILDTRLVLVDARNGKRAVCGGNFRGSEIKEARKEGDRNSAL